MGLTIGLTGGIASGKSTVTTMLRELNFPVIDADVIAREVVEKGENAYLEIVDAFGPSILHNDGAIDRVKLGDIVFRQEDKRKILNAIVHPAIRNRMNELKDKFLADDVKAIVLDIPLLFESQLTHMVDKTIVVYVNSDIQLKRLMSRNHFSEEEALARINSQMPLDDKVKLADEVVNNNWTLEETREQLLHILSKWELV